MFSFIKTLLLKEPKVKSLITDIKVYGSTANGLSIKLDEQRSKQGSSDLDLAVYTEDLFISNKDLNKQENKIYDAIYEVLRRDIKTLSNFKYKLSENYISMFKASFGRVIEFKILEFREGNKNQLHECQILFNKVLETYNTQLIHEYAKISPVFS